MTLAENVWEVLAYYADPRGSFQLVVASIIGAPTCDMPRSIRFPVTIALAAH